MSTEEGIRFINEKFAMTEPQRRVLLRAGYSPEELEGVKKWDAKKLIDACVANHWKRPAVKEPEPEYVSDTVPF